MKNPPTLLDELFISGMTEMCLTAVATLEFCYDHLEEDTPFLSQEPSPVVDQIVLSQKENLETE
jgi:hypothetical protein